ncbi:flavodoxin family protein [Aureibacter tunicatorum]|uniref:NADPH-quinone reductase n=1 Tax=Aureibacter tunicatorum TaxID=866807 RepID=A0AAE4BTQ6_9BACT|nr:NAD(P)H-dependent oxidoreductase [Aureibacter tunicatorum]MDR6240205.1 putative NADPH-quinone reductase [Aureibacter tunicatorum]
MSGIIFLGTARKKGNTHQVAKLLAEETGFEFRDLSEYTVGPYDYEYNNSEDDFIALAEEMVKYDKIVLASPVYWYTMSAQLKAFIDRFSDLVRVRKDLGRALEDKKMYVLSCGSGDFCPEHFTEPFKYSANYLNMNFQNHLHTWGEKDGRPISEEIVERVKEYALKIK